MKLCSIDDCGSPTVARGWCSKHYQEWKRSRSVPCEVEACELSAVARGWCGTHYQRWRTSGSIDARPKLTYPENLLRRLRFCPPGAMPTGCIEFTGGLTAAGYGLVQTGGRKEYTHRLAYEMARGPIPDGLEIDHLCRNRSCCNPGHLEPVTHAENMRRTAVPA